MLTSLQKAKDQGAKIIAVNPLPEVSLMRVTNPNPQDYPNPLELPIALLGKGQALADLYLPVRVNGDVAAIKGILKELFERERAGRPSAIDHEFIQDLHRGLRRAAGRRGSGKLGRDRRGKRADTKPAACGRRDVRKFKKDDMRVVPGRYPAAQRRR